MYELLRLLRDKAKESARRYNPKRPVAYWREEDHLDGQIVRAFVGILRTRGCYWALTGGCTMCGYIKDAYIRDLDPSELRAQIKYLSEEYSGEPYVKIFTSGSFLDPKEIPYDVYEDVLSAFSDAKVISIESRPEFVKDETLKILSRLSDKFNIRIEISIGLESSNEQILRKLINKGFSIKDYVTAAKRVKKHGFLLKTYILLKPPFVSEFYALKTGINSALFALNFSDRVSVNPTVIQPYTIVEDLYRKGLYRPPWVFTLIVLLKRVKVERPEKVIVSYPMKKLKKEGLRGCDSCLKESISRIVEFSLTQRVEVLSLPRECPCYKLWLREVFISKRYPYLY
ncbi:MAG: TIGR01210 family radical SAM protein [Thermoplasmata archaeon]|nr:MAG: TIGR01210 family radical SAM protein [Thermoplasmata archaeon]